MRTVPIPLGVITCALGCAEPEYPSPAEMTPPPAAVSRLTDAQWRGSVRQLLGVDYAGYLPADYALHGHVSVGASVIATSPLEWELYEASAWNVANEAVGAAELRAARLPCALDVPNVDDALGCVRVWATDLARGAWRRPARVDEIDVLVGLARPAFEAGDPDLAARTVVAAVLASPHFLYRVETGSPDPTLPGAWRYTDDEIAARLALMLTNRGPDPELRADAEAGRLSTPAGVRAAAERLLDTAEAREAVARFWAEVFDLAKLGGATKSALFYPEFTPALREAMVREILWLLLDITYDRDADIREMFTTRATVVDGPLAALYGLPPVEGSDPIVTEVGPERGGLLGRAALAAIHSHPVSTSPTRRGKFIRTRLLCQSVPPPPPGVTASLDALPPAASTRERLEQHATDKACVSCHERIDPPGFGMENLDAIGKWRETEGSGPIDATGELDGAPFDGVAELGRVISEHRSLAGCFSLDLWRFASGQAEDGSQLDTIEGLGDQMAEDGFRWRSLFLNIVASDGFRRPAPGEVAAPAEVCNGADDDQDGAVDGVIRTCDADGAPGTMTCDGGAWSACAAAPASTRLGGAR
jgi:hypothetical protein